MSNKDIIQKLDELKIKYNNTVTELSKSDNNYFIKDDTSLISGDEFQRNEFQDIGYASVDAIDYYLKNETLIINFFEFKNMNLDSEDNSVKTRLLELIEEMPKSIPECYECPFQDCLKELCGELPNDKIEQLKDKAFESLVMLYSYFPEHQIELLNAEKYYYVVSHVTSKYPLDSPNPSNTKRRGNLRKRYDFLFKIQPLPYTYAQSINENTFKSLVHRK